VPATPRAWHHLPRGGTIARGLFGDHGPRGNAARMTGGRTVLAPPDPCCQAARVEAWAAADALFAPEVRLDYTPRSSAASPRCGEGRADPHRAGPRPRPHAHPGHGRRANGGDGRRPGARHAARHRSPRRHRPGARGRRPSAERGNARSDARPRLDSPAHRLPSSKAPPSAGSPIRPRSAGRYEAEATPPAGARSLCPALSIAHSVPLAACAPPTAAIGWLWPAPLLFR
jgi:hypothetical protein